MSANLPRFDNPAYCLGARLRKATRQVNRHYERHIEASGLKGTQFTILMTLSGMGRTQIQPLADYLGADRTTLTRNLERLKQAGWVSLTPDVLDRRVHWIALTPAGEQQLAEALPCWQAAQAEMVARLGPDAERLLGLLSALEA